MNALLVLQNHVAFSLLSDHHDPRIVVAYIPSNFAKEIQPIDLFFNRFQHTYELNVFREAFNVIFNGNITEKEYWLNQFRLPKMIKNILLALKTIPIETHRASWFRLCKWCTFDSLEIDQLNVKKAEEDEVLRIRENIRTFSNPERIQISITTFFQHRRR